MLPYSRPDKGPLGDKDAETSDDEDEVLAKRSSLSEACIILCAGVVKNLIDSNINNQYERLTEKPSRVDGHWMQPLADQRVLLQHGST